MAMNVSPCTLYFLTFLFLLPCGCSERYHRTDCAGESYSDVQDDEELSRTVANMIGDVPLPTNATDIWIGHGPFSPDLSHYLVFRTDRAGAEKFLTQFTGKPLHELATSGPTFFASCVGPGIEGFPWDACRITNGRYDETGWPVAAADLDRNIVYVIR